MVDHATLSNLIAPVLVPVFLEEYWQRQLLVINRDSPLFFSGILSLDDIDKIISSIKIPSTHIDLSKDSAPIPKTDFCIGEEVDLPEVMNLHRSGATIILRSLHRWSTPLQAIKLSMEKCFHCPAQTNVYLTPPSNKSSPPHFDAHDIFVMQLKGSKRWRIYEVPLPLPLISERFDPVKHPVGTVCREFTLHPGDLAYLPRGTVHEPDALEYSVHISVGVMVKTWTDLIGTMLKIASVRHVELRKALPVSPSGGAFDSTYTLDSFANCVEFLKDPSIALEALEYISENFISSRDVSVAGQLRLISTGSETPSLDTLVCRREGLIHRIRRTNGKVHLDFRRVTLSLADELEQTVRFAAEKQSFRPRELPGELSDADKVGFVQRLIEEGFLIIKD